MPIVRVLPDVTGLDREFSYRVPEEWAHPLVVGDRVRVPLHGRSVPGWVVALDDHGDVSGLEPGDSLGDVELKGVRSRTGCGPAPEIVELARWAAWRWAGRRRVFLGAASPPTAVARLPLGRATGRAPEPRSPATTALLGDGGGVLRLPPASDVLPVIASGLALGPVIVVVPAARETALLGARLRRAGVSVAVVPDEWAAAAGGVDVVIGPRSAAWAPCPDLAAVVVVDEHDEALQSEASPTWHARDVMLERCRRAGVPLVLVSPIPSLEALSSGRLVHPPAAREARGWPRVEVVDRSDDATPWSGSLLSSELIEHLRTPERRVLCVMNATGWARLTACRSCRAVARCERCGAAVRMQQRTTMVCPQCATERPAICGQCNATALAVLRPGVGRLREELEAAAGRPVGEVTGAGSSAPEAHIQVGTEAVLHRHTGADVVAFLDFDREMLAPRFRAAEHALALLVRAGRLVGPRTGDGCILIQTRLADHEVIRAARLGSPEVLTEAEEARRSALGLPPFGALAEIGGAGTDDYLASLPRSDGLSVAVADGSALVRAPTTTELCDALAAATRPPGLRLRIAVDPPRC